MDPLTSLFLLGEHKKGFEKSIILDPESQGESAEWLIVPKVIETCEQVKIGVRSEVRALGLLTAICN